jgi:hypothetical protein
MQMSGYRRHTTVAGVGLVAGLLTLATSAWISCSPGALNCDDFNNCEPIGGGAAGSGGGSTTPPPKGGSGGSAPAAAVSATTAIPGCPTYPTLADMDKFIAMRCGGKAGMQSACHGTTGAPFGDYSKANAWMWALDKKAVLTCTGDNGKFIDKANPLNSLFWLKVANMMPKCPGGSSANAVMPFQDAQMIPALTAAEQTCMKNFVTVAAGKTP